MLIWLLLVLMLVPFGTEAQQKMVKILVSTPNIQFREYMAVGDVIAGSITREFTRMGGVEIIERERAEEYLKSKGLDEWIGTRELALEVGEELGADIVVFSSLSRKYDNIFYTIYFLEIDRDILQRTLRGYFLASSSANEIGRRMKTETEKLFRYIPKLSELADPGVMFREESVNPERLPVSAEIEDLPPIDNFLYIEQVFSYFRVFPGETEYQKLQQQKILTRFKFREDLDEELTDVLNNFQIYGDFAMRHNLQAFLIKDCSVRAINVLLANRIPVFYTDGILIGYSNLRPDGYCFFKNIENQLIESYDLTHRKRVAAMFIVPKLGTKLGFSKSYLEEAVGYYNDEFNKTPRLVEISDSMFDIISSGLTD
ncbi:hypothetical protein ACFL1R_10830 [Candidatus Latescibacterota bacterium]